MLNKYHIRLPSETAETDLPGNLQALSTRYYRVQRKGLPVHLFAMRIRATISSEEYEQEGKVSHNVCPGGVL